MCKILIKICWLACFIDNVFPIFAFHSKQTKPIPIFTMLKNLALTVGVFIASGAINILMATPTPPGPSIIPIDGGVSLLVAACAGYGAKKIYDARKEKSGK